MPHLLSTAVPPDLPYMFAEGQHDGLAKAWQCVRPGDRLVIIADVVDEALAALQPRPEAGTLDGVCAAPVALSVPVI